MSEFREVRTQAELDKALGEQGVVPICVGSGYFSVSAANAPYGSAQVEASGSAQVRAYGSAQVNAGKFVAVTVHAGRWGTPKITGGVVIEIPKPSTAEDWCELKGVELIEVDGKPAAVLFKAVREDFRSAQVNTFTNVGVFYTPGTVPVAEDWDGGEQECGRGLHFSPHAWMTREFAPSGPVKYVACPVWLEDISVHADASMPQKCKARACCAPVWEVTVDGDRVEPEATATQGDEVVA